MTRPGYRKSIHGAASDVKYAARALRVAASHLDSARNSHVPLTLSLDTRVRSIRTFLRSVVAELADLSLDLYLSEQRAKAARRRPPQKRKQVAA